MMHRVMMEFFTVFNREEELSEKKMNTAIGHNELYKMGFDGAGIVTLRKLSSEQIKRLNEILQELKKEKERKSNVG